MKKKKSNWYFTFGAGQAHDGCYIKFFGTRESTRERMFDAFSQKWSMQYSEKEWNNPRENSLRFNGFDDGKPHTMAEVWNWKEIK